jgi:hypothetical protein
MSKARSEAAAILHRVLATLRLPERVAAYLRGYAEGLGAEPRRRRRSR